MNQPEIFPAPVLDLSPAPPASHRSLPEDDKWDRERLAFFRLLPDLLQTHRDQFVAIHEGRVVASGAAVVPVALQAHQQHGSVPIYVGLVSDQPTRRARIPGPRLVRGPKPS